MIDPQLIKQIKDLAAKGKQRPPVALLTPHQLTSIRSANLAKARPLTYNGNLDADAVANLAHSVCRCDVDLSKLHLLVHPLHDQRRIDRALALVGRNEAEIPYLAYDSELDIVRIVGGNHRVSAMLELGFSRTFACCHQHHLPDIQRILA
ncbi:hypothetical protein F1640_11295 [Novosphingobium sp. NBM11]|uniref:hypothetical protein n=1 Tax=Novosphingobium sp. NBM11 TaxID=2596914 RepID=UPI0018921CD9|nr:hypothetical protein [Novosphingobium sp. NBM11]MBF5090587.1 hypothetical protein [Novosphingobium sp. NBM11]